MKGLFQRRLCVLLASAAAAFAVWKSVPGTKPDDLAFRAVASSFTNPPLFVSGRGTYAEPWALKGLSSRPKTNKLEAPVIVSLGDDVQGFFQSSPPDPIDFAVIFRNFQRLGARKAATSVVMAWESPDPIGMAALDKTLGKFDSLVMAAPLSRGPVAAPLPPAFRRASVPLSSVSGDTALLPVVNRIPIPGTILGGENTAAGFSVLETESAPHAELMFARWDDRVVLAFPLLVVLQRLNLPAEGVEIRLGEFVKLGPDGPVIPIDEFGRLDLPVKSLAAYAEIPAESLIDGGDELFPKQAPDPVILRDDRSAADPATRGFSKEISGIVAAIASDDALTGAVTYRRLPEPWELAIPGLVVLAMTAFCGVPAFARLLSGLAVAGLGIAAQWVGFGAAEVWLPGFSVLAAVLAALLAAPLVRVKRPPPPPLLLPEIFLPSEPRAEIADTIPDRPPAAEPDRHAPGPKPSRSKKRRRGKSNPPRNPADG